MRDTKGFVLFVCPGILWATVLVFSFFISLPLLTPNFRKNIFESKPTNKKLSFLSLQDGATTTHMQPFLW